jgi:hypothetical protein
MQPSRGRTDALHKLTALLWHVLRRVEDRPGFADHPCTGGSATACKVSMILAATMPCILAFFVIAWMQAELPAAGAEANCAAFSTEGEMAPSSSARCRRFRQLWGSEGGPCSVPLVFVWSCPRPQIGAAQGITGQGVHKKGSDLLDKRMFLV